METAGFGIWFFSTYKLISEPDPVSWVLAIDKDFWAEILYYSWQSKQHEHQHICFVSLCPNLMGTMWYGPVTAIHAVCLRCCWQTLSLGNSPLLGARSKQACSLSPERYYLIFQCYQMNKQSCPPKRADSDEEIFSKGCIMGKPTVSGDWKTSEQSNLR